MTKEKTKNQNDNVQKDLKVDPLVESPELNRGDYVVGADPLSEDSSQPLKRNQDEIDKELGTSELNPMDTPDIVPLKDIDFGDIVIYFPGSNSKPLDNDAPFAAAIVVGLCEEDSTVNLKVFRDANQPNLYVTHVKHVNLVQQAGESFFVFRNEAFYVSR